MPAAMEVAGWAAIMCPGTRCGGPGCGTWPGAGWCWWPLVGMEWGKEWPGTWPATPPGITTSWPGPAPGPPGYEGGWWPGGPALYIWGRPGGQPRLTDLVLVSSN